MISFRKIRCMKWLFLLIISFPLFAQQAPNSEIFIFEITASRESVVVKDGKNISQNEGYDNQPCFYSPNLILYSKNRDGQTDIARYDINEKETSWVSNTAEGGEYSPQPVPGSKDVAAVRLDTTGLQRLYKYNWETGESSLILPDFKVGYFAFYNDTLLLTSVLTERGMDLMLNDLESNNSKILVKQVGRSLHKVPKTHSMSYTVMNEEGTNLDLYLLDLDSEEPTSFYLCTLPEGVNDYTWLDENRILLGQGSKLLMYDMLGGSEWKKIADLSEYGLDNISRITVNEDLTKLAMAAEVIEKN